MKSYSSTHVLNTSPHSGPVALSTFGLKKYFHIAQAITSTLNANIK
jgi:hypothetical protein